MRQSNHALEALGMLGINYQLSETDLLNFSHCTNPAEYYALLYALARFLPVGGWCLETGTDDGGSASRMTQGAFDSSAAFYGTITIDHAGHEHEQGMPQAIRSLTKMHASLDWTAHDVHPYIVHVCTDSRNAAAIINAACKLVFIDGEHSTEAVVHDIRAFGAMVKPGGVLVVDDFSPDDPILGQPAQDTIDMFGYFEEQVWFNRRCLVARRDT